MTELDREAVRRRLALIAGNLERLRSVEGMSLQEYRADLAETLAPSAGLRHRLVHEYDEIDDGIVLASVADARRDFSQYLEAVEQYLAQ